MKAVFRAGELHFTVAESTFFFGDTGFCPDEVWVRSERGRVVWHIKTEELIHPCDLFPLRFGAQPTGLQTLVAPEPLRSGELYLISGTGGDMYRGAFRYEERHLRRVSNEPDAAKNYPPYYGLEWQESQP